MLAPFLLCLLSPSAIGAEVVSLKGQAVDAFVLHDAGSPRLYVSIAGKNRRGVMPVSEPVRDKKSGANVGFRPAPKGAVSVGSCAQKGVALLVFETAAGLVNEHGKMLLAGEALAVIPDRDHLYVGQHCAALPGHRNELRLVTREGIKVAFLSRPNKNQELRSLREIRTLAWPHLGRSYSGRVHRGLRPARPYAAAHSVYAPHFTDGDVDHDGRTDLIVHHEGRLAVYLRDAGGRLAEKPAATLDLIALTGGPGGDLRVHFGDLDDNGHLDAVLGRAQGPMPERSSGWWLRSSKASSTSLSPPIFDHLTRLWDEEGLVAPLAIVKRPLSKRDPHSGSGILTTRIETSAVSLGRVLLSSRLQVRLQIRRAGDHPTFVQAQRIAPAPTVGIHLDLRRMETSGALPLATVDLDGDGLTDLLDLGTPGEARVFLGNARGFSPRAKATFSVPRFVHVVALPAIGAVVLLGPPGRTTKVAIISAR